ncbi:leucine-rich repeat domain-containing protein [Culicoidibacter larvae]|uniref:LPXTG cell wall anchor domain-containing protein n=1 Tax=Culicoidibacter larvae TaxID=2579976 RepID=A0A5R8Q8C7_9FIRM|nr:LPXTG cell wall anchor domain-containing protein [Culicoidibacter larvae]TLG71751.1 LPXTG cell wall anchor domain-containing protein [Culicoidibacter larvae]
MKKLKVLLSVLTIAALSGSVAPTVFAEDTGTETSGENVNVSDENTLDESASNEAAGTANNAVTEEKNEEDNKVSVFASGDEVTISDPALKAALNGLVSSSRNADDILTQGDLASISGSISLASLGIEDITGIEYLVNVTKIDLRDNIIQDITPLASMTQLTKINVTQNIITDFRPLQGLTNLTVMAITDQYMYYQISDFDGTAINEFIAPDGTPMTVVAVSHDGNYDAASNTISWTGLENTSSVEYLVSHRVTLNGINTIFNGAQEIRYTTFVNQNAVEPTNSASSTSTGTTSSTLPNTGENSVEFALAGAAVTAIATVILVRRKK